MSDNGGRQPAVSEAHLNDVPVELKFELGAAHVPLRDLRTFGEGRIFKLGKSLDSAVEVRFSGELIGFGDLVIIDGALAVRVTRVAGQ